LKSIESVLAEGHVKTPDLAGRATTADMSKAITTAMNARQPA